MTSKINREISIKENIDTVLNSVKMALMCAKGEFYPNKDYGSRLMANMTKEELTARARCAVDSIDGVYIKEIKLNNNQLEAIILINDTERSVSISLE